MTIFFFKQEYHLPVRLLRPTENLLEVEKCDHDMKWYSYSSSSHSSSAFFVISLFHFFIFFAFPHFRPEVNTYRLLHLQATASMWNEAIIIHLTAAMASRKVQVGKDQEKAQSEKDSHSKNRGGKKPNQQSGTYTMKHIVSRMSSYFPNRWPLSYLNLTKI